MIFQTCQKALLRSKGLINLIPFHIKIALLPGVLYVYLFQPKAKKGKKAENTGEEGTVSCTVLTHKAPPIVCSRRQFKFCRLFENNK